MSINSVSNTFFSKSAISYFKNNVDSFIADKKVQKYITSGEKTYKDLFVSKYSLLSKNYQNEYFYKNTLFNQIIFDKHIINSTTVFTELNIGKSIADFVTLNGKSVVYEIKTEFDSLERIEHQISEYYKFSPYVCVVTCRKHLNKVKELFINSNVGIYYYGKNNRIVYFKKPVADYSKINKNVLFSLLRKNEYEEILRDNHLSLPDVRQVEYYSACKKKFATIDVNVAIKCVIKLLKKRKNAFLDKLDVVPYELRMLVYESNFTEEQFDCFFSFLNKKIDKRKG